MFNKTQPISAVEFINRSIAYFTEDVTRRNSNGNIARYAPTHNNTEGCIIGIWVDDQTKIKLDQAHTTMLSDKINNILPEWMMLYGKTMLSKLQRLHDEPINWSTLGLSNIGISKQQELLILANEYDLTQVEQ